MEPAFLIHFLWLNNYLYVIYVIFMGMSQNRQSHLKSSIFNHCMRLGRSCVDGRSWRGHKLGLKKMWTNIWKIQENMENDEETTRWKAGKPWKKRKKKQGDPMVWQSSLSLAQLIIMIPGDHGRSYLLSWESSCGVHTTVHFFHWYKYVFRHPFNDERFDVMHCSAFCFFSVLATCHVLSSKLQLFSPNFNGYTLQRKILLLRISRGTYI